MVVRKLNQNEYVYKNVWLCGTRVQIAHLGVKLKKANNIMTMAIAAVTCASESNVFA